MTPNLSNFADTDARRWLSDARRAHQKARYHHIVRDDPDWRVRYIDACVEVAIAYQCIAHQGATTFPWRCRYERTVDRWIARAQSAV